MSYALKYPPPLLHSCNKARIIENEISIEGITILRHADKGHNEPSN